MCSKKDSSTVKWQPHPIYGDLAIIETLYLLIFQEKSHLYIEQIVNM